MRKLGLFLVLGVAASAVSAGQDAWQDELQALRKKRQDLEERLKQVRGQEAVVVKAIEARDKGYYARVEIKGRLERKTIPAKGPFAPFESVVWIVHTGADTFELSFVNTRSSESLLRLADGLTGKSVVVTGDLVRAQRALQIFVRTFAAAK